MDELCKLFGNVLQADVDDTNVDFLPEKLDEDGNSVYNMVVLRGNGSHESVQPNTE